MIYFPTMCAFALAFRNADFLIIVLQPETTGRRHKLTIVEVVEYVGSSNEEDSRSFCIT
jgi:hypothetical protein